MYLGSQLNWRHMDSETSAKNNLGNGSTIKSNWGIFVVIQITHGLIYFYLFPKIIRIGKSFLTLQITGPNNTIPVVEIDVSKNGKLEPLTEDKVTIVNEFTRHM